jgi:serine/threonine-protein kinase
MPISFGPYELIERLGEGGMAEVWSAKKRGTGGFERVVCIKRIRLDRRQDAEIAERFLREARVLGHLHHANIAQIYDAGQIEDEYFIEMEFLHGKDLRSVLQAQLSVGPPPPGLAISVVMDVGRALDHAHRLLGPDGAPTPIVHRDITAANVMLSFDGSVKLLDFGLARGGPTAQGERRLTTAGAFVGTAGYIAPEVLRGGTADAKSDQFALGVVFYEALTCRRLLDAAIARERPPSECNAAIPPALDAVCLRALSEDPMQRFSSCGSFVNAIDAAAPRLGIGAVGIAALLKDRFGGSKQQSPATIAQPVVRSQKPSLDDLPTVMSPTIDERALKSPGPTHPAPAKRAPKSNAPLWLAGVGAVALLASAIVYRMRAATPTAPATPAPVAAAPPIVDAAMPVEPGLPPKEAAAKAAAKRAELERGGVKQGDLMDPFDDKPKRKKKHKNDNSDDMLMITPRF